ncbi:MAG: alpha-amylase family glycosyl hydrolase [Capsulimonadales bacterium]|nr:alpha-amylase family glycosyl hydrolase [Capsulimonadales bacterium]
MPITDTPLLRFENDRLTLEFDTVTGHWVSMNDRQENTTIFLGGESVRPVLLTVGGRTTARRGINQLIALTDTETIGLHGTLDRIEQSRSATENRLIVRWRENDWRVALRYTLRPGSTRLERTVRIEYVGEEETLLRYFTLRTPLAHLGSPADTYLEAPGFALRPGRRVSSFLPGPIGIGMQGPFSDSPAWHPPLIGLHHPESRRALLFWAHTETEPFYPSADRYDHGLGFSHRVYLADRFRRGHALEWGTQFLELRHEDWMTALARFPDFYDEAGFHAPEDVADWARSLNLYEVHVGTLTGTGLAPYPTYEPLIADLPRIRANGFDAVYIMPHVPYPSYSVIDYRNMEIQQGSDQGFRAFIRRAHELNLKVFMDVTMHGVLDRRARRLLATLDGHRADSYPVEPSMPEEHPYLAAHPEWFCRNEDGDIAMTYTYAFDHACPSWQDFMVDVFRYYVEEYDVDGFRVDSHTWNFFPNWARDLPYPASRSFYGSAQLFRRVRRELKAIKPDVVLYTETPGPLLHTSHEMSYNYDEAWLLLSLLPLRSRRGMLCHFAQAGHVTGPRLTAADIARWMTQRRYVLPRGAIKMRSLDSHDSYWRPQEFRSATFGIPASRAIVGLFAFLDGGFMDYNGADRGSEAFYRKVMRLRRSEPALREGTCDLLAVTPSDPMAIAPLRQTVGQTLLAVLYFEDRSARIGLPIPPDVLPADHDTFLVRDRMSGRIVPGPNGNRGWKREELTDFAADMKPYGVRLLEFVPDLRTRNDDSFSRSP